MRDGRAMPRLRERSPVHGLRRGGLGPLEVLAQSVSGAAPSAAMAATPVIVAAAAGGATVWSFVVATLLALLIAGCIGRFTRRMAAPGGLYSLTSKGLNPGAAFACGAALLVGYGMLAAASLTGAATFLQALVARLGGPAAPLVPAAAVLAIGLVVGALALRGVRLSARVVLLVELVSITVMLAVFGLLLAAEPTPAAAGVAPEPQAGVGGIGGITAGVLPALAAFIGFEIATALGAEARRPFRTVPRAVTSTAAVSGLLCVFAAYTQVVGFAGAPGGLAAQSAPVVTLAAARGWPWIPVLLDLGLTMSFFACALATTNALARVLFSLARDGVAARAFGRTHPRFATPHVAIGVALPVIVVALAAPLAAGVALGPALMFLLTVATGGFLVAYLLVCLAAPVFLHRIGELTWPAVVATAVIVPILLVALVAYVVASGGTPVVVVLGVLAVVAGTWFGWLRVRRPAQIAAIGVYDETVAADVLGDPGRAA